MSKLATNPAFFRQCRRRKFALSFVVVAVVVVVGVHVALEVLALAGIVVVAPDGAFCFGFPFCCD